MLGASPNAFAASSPNRSSPFAIGFLQVRQAARPDFTNLAPLDRIRAMFWRLYEFSRDHPQYFALMFVDRDVPRITREYERFAFVREMKARLAAQVQECIAAQVMPATMNPAVAVRVLTMGETAADVYLRTA